MRFLSRVFLTLFALTWLLTGFRSHAQGFGIIVSNAPAPTSIGGTLNYTYTVTNESGFLPGFSVTNTFSENVNFLSISNTYPTNSYFISTNNNALLFTFYVFSNADVITFNVAVQPTIAGPITNFVDVSSSLFTNQGTTNIITTVYGTTADLGVSLTPPVQAVITNDLTSYQVSITNLGPQTATGVFLTNTLPPGVIVKGVSPNSPGYSLSGSNMVFNIGTLSSNGGGQTFTISIVPTNVETATLSASIGSASSLDTNLTNNFASTSVTFSNYLAGVLVAYTNSTQLPNYQNGTEEQSIVVSNAGAVDVPAVRVVVTGLTNRLFNAVGTNGGNPFVDLTLPTPLSAGQSVTAHLQYLPHNAFPFTNGQLHAFALPPPNWTPPWFGNPFTTSTNINIQSIIKIANGEILLQFPTATNKTYTIVYSDNVLFTNPQIAPPSILSSANLIQWDDYGPPETPSFPTNSMMRFYRVYQNP